MTLTIEKPEEEKLLRRAARSRGLKPDALIEEAHARNRAIASSQEEKLKALFSQWDKEDATDDPEELKRRDEEVLETHHALNENRKATGEALPFPELEAAE